MSQMVRRCIATRMGVSGRVVWVATFDTAQRTVDGQACASSVYIQWSGLPRIPPSHPQAFPSERTR